ncbi:uncharacterized protein LOC118468171 [Anopheles albimanus]|uniref:uncharacterized protein LOC118464503 n=1 Tax=Anopheles albimanus TaxID=7167 RepID=UPI00163F33C6|nr:uncharacterized protein LOC118464503 [Anopheles albimanus]XP_035794888.1 uncharacterized protein LOC118468171 [Anopheles albimanus]
MPTVLRVRRYASVRILFVDDRYPPRVVITVLRVHRYASVRIFFVDDRYPPRVVITVLRVRQYASVRIFFVDDRYPPYVVITLSEQDGIALPLPEPYKQSVSTLLATTIARVLGTDGHWHPLCCIMDSGSQIDAITTAAATRLPMSLQPSRLQLDGVSGPLAVTRECESMVANCDGTHSYPVKFYVIPEVPNLPYRSLKGSDTGGGLLRQDATQEVRSYPCGVVTVEDDLRKCIERFWEVEDASRPRDPGTSTATAPELEDFSRETTSLAPDGRYVVKIPLRGELSELGDSYQHGVRRLLALERKLASHSKTYDDYRAFMREYVELGHMVSVAPEDAKRVRYVIPHSCVVKPGSSTTKLRVVFDASAKSTTGVSLNDLQTIGPVLQPDLLRIWLDFRLHTVVATADIAKMYRQIWVSDEDTWMQCILWRDHRTQPMQTYRLRTVTYGEAASSYLACRALQEAGEEVRASSPAVADAIRHGFYVDNLSLGAATSEELRVLCSGVEQALLRRGMPLRKWASNDDDVLQHVPPDHREAPVKIGDRDAVRMLGLSWCPTEDTFQLVIGDEILQLSETLTKRGLVARISKLYDPVGILQPVIITAKMLMQDLWREDLAWDDCVSPTSVHQWNEFTTQLPLLRKLHIPRMAAPSAPTTIRIDGFCDASLRAYGCVFYVTFTNSQGIQTTRLLCSKARVAPLKAMTLPCLELHAALLLSELYVRIRDASDSRVKETHWWSDSQNPVGHGNRGLALRAHQTQPCRHRLSWDFGKEVDPPGNYDLLAQRADVSALGVRRIPRIAIITIDELQM